MISSSSSNTPPKPIVVYYPPVRSDPSALLAFSTYNARDYISTNHSQSEHELWRTRRCMVSKDPASRDVCPVP